MKIAVVGYGYWGPNIVRNFHAIDKVTLKLVCDKDPKALERAGKTYNVNVTSHFDDVLKSRDIDAVAIITPVSSHYALAKKALEHGKHVFIEKPIASSSAEAAELIDLAEKKSLKLMVDHTFVFTGAVRKIKQLLDAGELGDLYYYDSARVNLGLFQHDVNVLWDLAPHDLSIMDFLLGKSPAAVSATGADHFGRGLEDIAYITAFFENNLIAHFNVNWLSPVKLRTTLIGGSRKMLVWNDLESDEKIKIYDKGVETNTKDNIYKMLIDYRTGDMLAPKLDRKEALRAELEYFVECVEQDLTPINDGHAGLRVLRILEAADRSVKASGALVTL